MDAECRADMPMMVFRQWATAHGTPEEHAERRLKQKRRATSRYQSAAMKKKATAPLIKRECMTCSAVFKSWGVGNRMCANCRLRSHYTSPYTPDAGGHTGRRVSVGRPK